MHLNPKQTNKYHQYFIERNERRCLNIEENYGREVVDYITKYADMADSGTEVMATAASFNIEIINLESLDVLINLKRINDIYNPNQFFSSVNEKLPPGGFFIGCVETIGSRKRRILNKNPRLIAYPHYFLDFILKRVFPKMILTAKINRFLTRGENKAMSLTETLGRLVACGFDLVDYREIGYLTYFVCKKIKIPFYSSTNKYGLIIRLKRIGRGGKFFDVYKFRTMHSYAEYLQTHVFTKNHFCDGCKFMNDFRITSWGRVMRKFWIDELPMFINWFRREMKIVGVRPLSEQFFSLYPQEFRLHRINYKPGLLPPFYADLPKTFEEIILSEQKYLAAYDQSPWLTDFRYFLKGVYNILIKRARSA